MVRQEIWALLLTHYAIRTPIYEAADPDNLTRCACRSFGHCASSAAMSPGRRVFPPKRLAISPDYAIAEILQRLNPARRHRTCPRASPNAPEENSHEKP